MLKRCAVSVLSKEIYRSVLLNRHKQNTIITQTSSFTTSSHQLCTSVASGRLCMLSGWLNCARRRVVLAFQSHLHPHPGQQQQQQQQAPPLALSRRQLELHCQVVLHANMYDYVWLYLSLCRVISQTIATDNQMA